MKTKRLFEILIFLIAFSVVSVCISLPVAIPVMERQKIAFLIDAGHGLPDGGAVAVDGTKEQALNLSIAEKLFEKFPDGTALLTRRDEQGIYTSGMSIREKKISDMKERIRIADEHPSAMIVSVHMNTFPNSSVHGFQVFFKKDDTSSKALAETIQQHVNENLQPDHPKTAKPIAANLYLFSKTKNPAILVECGFMTNQNDLAKLKDETYQQKIAQILYDVLK